MIAETTAIVLCGGAGDRLDGADKPLLEWRGAPMIAHLVEHLAPHTTALLISANRNADRYADYGTVVSDGLPDYQGPLAGLAACLPHCLTEFVFVCPGDCPDLPEGLVERLRAQLGERDAAVAHDGERRQNLHLLLRADLTDNLGAYLAQGGRSMHGWLSELSLIDVDCSDMAAGFRNFNAPADFVDSERDSQ